MGTCQQKIKYSFSVLLFLSVFLSGLYCVNPAVAATETSGLDDAFKTDKNMPLGTVIDTAGFNKEITHRDLIGGVIKAAMSLMGVIFLILAIYAGYNWMTARGNEEQVEKAKSTLINAIIGIVIVMAAYAISYFIISSISTPALKSTGETEQK